MKLNRTKIKVEEIKKLFEYINIYGFKEHSFKFQISHTEVSFNGLRISIVLEYDTRPFILRMRTPIIIDYRIY